MHEGAMHEGHTHVGAMPEGDPADEAMPETMREAVREPGPEGPAQRGEVQPGAMDEGPNAGGGTQ
jgi:hypothetical protein